MATKDIENAWNIHDHIDNPDCDKKPGWNEKLAHSRFNPGCKVWVEEYAKNHPLPPPAPAPPSRKSIYPRQTCAGCGRINREDRMKKLMMEDVDAEGKVLQHIEVLVCGNRCGKRASRKIAREHPTMAPASPETKEGETVTTDNFNQEKMKDMNDNELRAKKIKEPKHYAEAMYNKAIDWELERRERERKDTLTQEQPKN